MGGIGKTTLAKLVYNDDDVKNHFDTRIWVCVSNLFDEIRVAKAILESLTHANPNLVELQSILEQIQQSISGKKFLLVLDDVWTEDRSKWEQLKCSLLSGSTGSRILTTTRKENVAKIVGCIESDIFPIGHLSVEECWSLFSQIVFAECTSKNSEQIEGICREIVAKCKGLPLAIRMLGYLCSGKSRTELQSILESEVWELEEAEVDLFPHLLLSYYDLPSALKRCFSYCAIFPKDYSISKHKLIESWMALGYLRATSREDMEKVGEKYFQKLAMCSLFQDYIEDRDDGSITFCHMHDIVHDFALYISKKECFVMEDIGSEGTKMKSLPKEACYSRLMVADDAPLLNILSGLKRLHSLTVQGRPSTTISVVQLTYMLEKLNLLRFLDLSNCNITEIPSAICKLVHLKKLDLSFNGLKNMLETVCELVNLQTLNISCGGDGFAKLPNGIGKLLHLRHLHNSPNVVLPKGVGSLTCLRTLDDVCLGYGGQDFSLADLENLNHLQGKLSIKGLNGDVDVVAAKQAKLKTKARIIYAVLGFEGEKTELRNHHDKGIIEELEPSPNLEHLFL
ncbi:putative disease resistance protein RGA3 [Mercurialis annua]|uniref:putative disease resistance protein RGA3 n=1 Tax=Mercurialis annua TaxID=3986 RepID=UPI00215F89D4|nr:putative disease resistance protein RGA3 [Mercurialis annua]